MRIAAFILGRVGRPDDLADVLGKGRLDFQNAVTADGVSVAAVVAHELRDLHRVVEFLLIAIEMQNAGRALIVLQPLARADFLNERAAF